MIKLIKKLFERKEIRFLFVGGLNTIIGYGLFALFVFLGCSATIATTLSTPLGTIHSYFWNKYFTFNSKKKSLPEFIRFISVYAVSYLLNILLAHLLQTYTTINPYIIGVIGLFFTTILSYFGHNFFSFKKNNTENTENKT